MPAEQHVTNCSAANGCDGTENHYTNQVEPTPPRGEGAAHRKYRYANEVQQVAEHSGDGSRATA